MDGTKYDHVVSHLPSEVLTAIRHIIRLPTATADRYQQLKDALIDTYGKTPATCTKELMDFVSCKEDLVDPKPSVAMMYIRDLSNSSYQAVERAMFLARMPAVVRTALANSKTLNNDLFAQEANVIMEEYLLARSKMSVAIQEVQVPPPPAPAVDAVSRSSSGPPAPFLCFVHAKYGRQAFSCRSSRCPMRNQLAARPPPVSGNGRAGRQ